MDSIFIYFSIGSSGSVVYSDLSPGRYVLRIAAINYKKEDRAIVRRRFEVPSSPRICLLHLVNDGLVVNERSSNVSITFDGVGPVDGFLCSLDGGETVPCKSHTLVLGACKCRGYYVGLQYA